MAFRFDTTPETGSTNADLLARIAGGEVLHEGYWLRAERQSRGKGRSGRIWESDVGNLYCSTVVGLRPSDPAAHTLSLVAGLAVHDLLEMQLLLGISDNRFLKWPNDLLYEGAKIAGILCERVANTIIVGIGINVEFAPVLPDRETTAIQLQNSHNTNSPAAVLEALAPHFAARLDQWRNQPLGVTLSEWEDRAHARGTRLHVTDNGKQVTGTFDGLAEDGALQLRLLDGSLRIIHAGDVELEG